MAARGHLVNWLGRTRDKSLAVLTGYYPSTPFSFGSLDQPLTSLEQLACEVAQISAVKILQLLHVFFLRPEHAKAAVLHGLRGMILFRVRAFNPALRVGLLRAMGNFGRGPLGLPVHDHPCSSDASYAAAGPLSGQ